MIDYLFKDFTKTYFTAYNFCMPVSDMNNPI